LRAARITLALAFAIVQMPVAAVAAVEDIASLFQMFDHGTDLKGMAETLIAANAAGLSAANASLASADKPMLYCAPERISLTGEQLIDILRRYVETKRARVPMIDTMHPAVILLFALEDAFPCGR
jgi:hypothetical protein